MRVIVKFPDGYVNIEAEEFHEENEFLKIYNSHQELVGMFKEDYIFCAYRTGEEK